MATGGGRKLLANIPSEPSLAQRTGPNAFSWREKVFGQDETLCRCVRKCLGGTKHFVVARESDWPGRNTLSWREKVFGRDETLCRGATKCLGAPFRILYDLYLKEPCIHFDNEVVHRTISTAVIEILLLIRPLGSSPMSRNERTMPLYASSKNRPLKVLRDRRLF